LDLVGKENLKVVDTVVTSVGSNPNISLSPCFTKFQGKPTTTAVARIRRNLARTILSRMGTTKQWTTSVDAGIRGKRAKAIPVTLIDTSMVDYSVTADFLHGQVVQ
jgi:hypothetical protein